MREGIVGLEEGGTEGLTVRALRRGPVARRNLTALWIVLLYMQYVQIRHTVVQ